MRENIEPWADTTTLQGKIMFTIFAGIFINILKLNKKMVNLLFSFSSSRHDKLISKLIHFSLDDLRSILNTIASNKPYAFLIEYCELDQEDINHLCVMHTKYSRNSVNMAKIDYAIGIRPYKGSYSLIEKLQIYAAAYTRSVIEALTY